MALGVPEILDALDRSAALDWPDFWGITMTEYHALRLIAVRSKTGDEWGIVFDSIRGSVIDEFRARKAGGSATTVVAGAGDGSAGGSY